MSNESCREFCEALKVSSPETVKILGRMTNNFGFKKQEVIDAVIEAGLKKEFELLIALCAIYMGYTWECEERNGCTSPHWDERMRASQGFSYSNLNFFEDLFEKTTGSKFPWSPNKQGMYFDKDQWLDRTDKIKYEMLYPFYTEHSTLKQTMFRMFYEYLTQEYPDIEFKPAPGMSGISFPFI